MPESPPSATTLCPSCAEPLYADERFCEHCGADVTTTPPSGVPVTPAPAAGMPPADGGSDAAGPSAPGPGA
ncbi:zinc-ribbon domain-containing protein, partial [Streptomyces sp. CBMA29]|uniref:zinc-ribbon domain-containing protein n=1 Tax=Streptomyces sp. CBMA29 TaxID=1896314 RepID=UPI003980D610